MKTIRVLYDVPKDGDSETDMTNEKDLTESDKKTDP